MAPTQGQCAFSPCALHKSAKCEEITVKTTTLRHLVIALVGSLALGVGTGCTGFWAASAPDSESRQEMEKAEPIEDTTMSEGEEAAERAESDEMESESEATAAEEEVGAETETEPTGTDKPRELKKMTLAAAGAESVTAEMYWDVEKNTAMGTKELKLQLVAAGSGAEMKACREVKVSADSKSFMGDRVGIEVEERAERLTAYLPQDALDQIAAANAVRVFVCEYEFGLGPAEQKMLSDLQASEPDIESESEPGSDEQTGEEGDAPETGMDEESGVEETGPGGQEPGSEETGNEETGNEETGSEY